MRTFGRPDSLVAADANRSLSIASDVHVESSEFLSWKGRGHGPKSTIKYGDHALRTSGPEQVNASPISAGKILLRPSN